MAIKPKGDFSNDKEQQQKMKARGTQDDMEVLRMVICENRGLQTRVLDKIRAILSQSETYGEAFKEKGKKSVQKIA